MMWRYLSCLLVLMRSLAVRMETRMMELRRNPIMARIIRRGTMI